MPLSSVERRSLRARAHALKPVVLIGGAGLSQPVLAEVSRALDDHELIKVRLPGVERSARDAMAAQLCAALGAQDVQGIGHVRVLFRARPEASVPPPRRSARRTRQT